MPLIHEQACLLWSSKVFDNGDLLDTDTLALETGAIPLGQALALFKAVCQGISQSSAFLSLERMKLTLKENLHPHY
jgi:hypothetical protein